MFGANVPQAGSTYEKVRSVALECEKYGFDFVWISDHLQDFASKNPYLECWTTLSALAEATKRVRLCTLVLNNQLRNPSLLARMAATFDTISNGRLEIGIGAGWVENECISNGIEFPAAPIRIQRLEEAIEVIERLWTSDNVSFSGKYYQLTGVSSDPKPVQVPHPPIWIGVMKSKPRMLRLIARFADVWTISSLYLPKPAEYQQIRTALHEACTAVGRDASLIESAAGIGCVIAKNEAQLEEKVRRFTPVSISIGSYAVTQTRVEGTPQRCLETLKLYEKLGVTRFVMNFPDITTLEPIRLFGEKIIPAFR